jgi:CheY-like chemotaxis protein
MSRQTVLIVDPNDTSRTNLRMTLESEGYTVVESEDSDQALDIANRSEVALLVTELYLHTGEDRCLVRAIRQSTALRRTKVLAYTSHARKADRAWAIEEGANGYVLKQNGPARLLEVVARMARSRPRKRRKPDSKK